MGVVLLLTFKSAHYRYIIDHCMWKKINMFGQIKNFVVFMPFLLVGTLGSANITDCLALGGQRSKCIIDGMLKVIEEHIAWDDWEAWEAIMKEFWSEDMIYDSSWTPNGDFSNNTGLKEFFYNEHIPYNLAFDNCTFSKMIWIGEETTASNIAYGKATWIGDLGTVPGSKHIGQEVTIWDLDFFRLDAAGEKIAYNWCFIDFVDLMRQVGYQVLPKPALPEGFMLPPAAMDGIPAPISRLADPKQGPRSKAIVQEILMNDFVEGSTPSSRWAEDMVWYGAAGFGMAKGVEEYEKHFLAPLREGLSQRKLMLDVVTCEGVYCGAFGYIEAVHSGVWLGEQPTNLPIRVRIALHWRVDLRAGLVPECWAMFDLPEAFRMLGINLFDRMNENYRIK